MLASALARLFFTGRAKSTAAPLPSTPTTRSVVPAIAICAFVFAFIFALWRMGSFQFFELQAYDAFVKHSAPTDESSSPIVIVAVTEEDLHRFNRTYIPDDALTDALQHLVAAQPAAIVLDLYRDLPIEGKDPAGRERLAALFNQHSNLIAIQRLGLTNEQAIAPPPFLADKPEQIGFNDFNILDRGIDDTVRRVTLMMERFDEVYYSDPLLASLLYLQAHGIDYSLAGTELHLGKSVINRLGKNVGPYVDADDRGYQVLLNFRGSTNYRTYTIADSIRGAVPPEAIRGKMVFVGPTAVSLKDFLSTPLNKRFPALLLHAQIADHLIRAALTGEAQLQYWTEWQETLWILGWCIAGTLAGVSARSPLALASVVVGCVALLVGAYWLALQAGLWLLVVAPGAGFACAAALSIAHQTYLEKSQRDVLMDLFAQHVSPNIATDIWKRRDEFMDGHRPKPQVIQGTVFFTDLKGFTGNAEAMPPEALINWLNEYMEVMAALIEQHGGMVNKYMGDAIMVVFGAPIPRTTDEEIRRDAANAARCAIAMARQLDRLNEDWKRRGLPTTTMRVGIASGPLVSGSIGGARRLEYTVTGDTVVIAKRLESAEKDSTSIEKASDSCRILMSEETFHLIGPRFRSRAIGTKRLEGKHQEVGAYVLIAEDESQKP